MKKNFITITGSLLCALLPLTTNAQKVSVKTPRLPRVVHPEMASDAPQTPITRSYPRLLTAKPVGKSKLRTVPTYLNAQQSKPAAAPAKADANAPTFVGNLIKSNEWDDTSWPYGIYSFKGTSGLTVSKIATRDDLNANGGGCFYNDVYHYINYVSYYSILVVTYYELNGKANWTETAHSNLTVSDYSLLGISSTYDRTTGTVYGCFYNSSVSSEEFGTIDYETQTRTKICDLKDGQQYYAMAASPEGAIYGIDGNGRLYSINKKNGEAKLIGSTGKVPGPYYQCATFDNKTGKLYWAFCSEGEEPNGLYEVDTNTGKATLISNFPNYEEFASFYIPDEYADAAPGQITDLKAVFPQGSYTGNVTFTVPTASVSGGVLQGPVKYDILVNGEKVLEDGTAMPGAAVTEEVMAETAGMASIVVVLKNDAGEGQRAITKVWAGPDVPTAVTDLNLTIDEETGKSHLTWKAPTLGSHGGELKESDLKYDVVRFPDSTTVATDLASCSFEETLPKGDLTAYYYKVYTSNNGVKGAPAVSNKQKLGDPLELPYAQDFADETSLDLIDIVNANHDKYTWRYTEGCVYNPYSIANNADDWLILPQMKLRPGRQYFVRFLSKGSSQYTEKMAVTLGKGTGINTANYQNLGDVFEIRTSAYKEFEREFSVPEEGTYRIAFHAVSRFDQGNLYLDSIRVEEGAIFAAPDSVTHLNVTAGETGALEATISFTTPVKTVDGNDIKQITKVNIYRDGELIKTIDKPATGTSLNYVDAEANNGFNTYTVTAESTEGEGRKAKATVFVGYDVPFAPSDVEMTDNLNGTGTLSWTTPGSVGINGGYVDTEALTYDLFKAVDGYAQIFKRGLTGNSYLYPNVATTGDQEYCYFALESVGDGGKSNLAVSSWIIAGAPYTLPFAESFPGGDLTYPFWSSDKTGEGKYAISSDYASDGDGGAAVFTASKEGDAGILGTGKLDTKNAKNPLLSFYYYAYPGKDLTLIVKAKGNGKTVNVLKTIDYKTLDGYSGWRREVIDLTDAVKGFDYSTILFHAKANTTESSVMIDNIVVKDLLDNDASVAGSCAKQVVAGKVLSLPAIITNEGKNTLDQYTASFYINDKLVETKQGTKSLKYEQTDTLNFAYKTKVTDPKTLKCKVVIEAANDEKADNNSTQTFTVNVLDPIYPAAQNLQGERTDKGVALSWTAPKKEEETKTEDFESLPDFEYTDLDPWTTVYDHNRKTVSWSDGESTFPHMGEAFGWIVFNPDQCTLDISSWATPHSGKKFLANVCNYKSPCNDAWLISTYLPGMEQTISFWAKSFAADYGAEAFEVRYSTTDNDTASFKTIALTENAVPYKWTQYEVTLPKGTHYFAIRSISRWKFMLLLDDITYTYGSGDVKGYNIYRDGELIKTVGADVTSFTDSDNQGEAAVYAVSAIYDGGESALSNKVSIAVSGITDVNAAADVEPFDVYTLDGVRVRTQVKSTKGLRPGAYIIDNKKVIIKK